MTTLKIFPSKNIKEEAGRALNEMVVASLSNPLLLLLSGGSSLDLIEHVSVDFLQKNGKNITIGMLDDRYSYDTKVNSFLILQDKIYAHGFYKKAVDAGVTFLNSSPKESETLEIYSGRYEEYVKKWLDKNPQGIIKATIGIGPDGHTSGILPFPEDPKKFDELFNNHNKLIAGYDVGNKNQYRYRMTSTFTLMKKFQESITYMTGENKKTALQKVLAKEGSLAETPGRIVQELQNNTIFTDITL